MLSKPSREISSGIEMPYSSAACNTPSAMESVEAKIVVAEQPFANSFRLSA